ncbi:MAG: hypothetical protein GF409_06355 [Candidatus Omnitrophica bacterium]|nr:hypothetical protein [Candidatus Omnitrophota bacterium]
MKTFEFTGCIEIKELLAEKAVNELQLMELIEEAPIDSIYYHTHSYFLRHFYLAGQYPNDFANWAALQVRDRILGEKLSVVTPSGMSTLEEIRTELLDIIDDHISSIKTVPSVVYGEPFYFMKSRIMEIPLGVFAEDLAGFIEGMENVHASAIYNHTFEARLRLKRGKSDFSIWLDDVLGLGQLAERIERIDSYMYSLEDLRAEIIELCESELKK